jgi:pre-mRNA-splicing factor 38B
MGAFVRDILLKQFYFETIFPRIPIVVERAIKEELRKQGLPTEAVGNGGTGGPDRRGVDEPNKRPPSVKAALSVSQGQTAPNRRAARESTFRTSGVKGDRDRGGGDRRREEPDRKPPKPYQASSRDRDYKRCGSDRSHPAIQKRMKHYVFERYRLSSGCGRLCVCVCVCVCVRLCFIPCIDV